MKTTLLAFTLTLCLFSTDLIGQSCNPPHQSSCDPNANFCSPTPLSNITCRPFRFTGLDGYWSFVGDGSTITITVTPNICFSGPPPGDGIAAQLLEDCSPVTMLPPPSHNLTDIVYKTEPCKVYTLYVLKVPGCSCDEIIINVQSSGGGGAPMIPRPVNLDIDGDLCVCNEIEVCTDVSAPCNLLYQWEINGAPRPDLTDLECIDYQIQSPAPVTICVNVILGSETTKCDEVKQCTTITPRQLPPVNEPLEVICWENHMNAGYQWYDKTLFSSCVNPPCTTRLQDRDGCCYDLIQPIILRRRPITTVKSVILCDSTELPYVTEDGQEWDEAVCNEIIYFKDPVYDCDTNYALTVSVLDPSIVVDRICDNPDELILTAKADLDIECPIGIVNYRLEWTNCKTGQVIGTDTFLTVTMPGEYCLNMIISYTNADGSKGECIKDGGYFNITKEDFGEITVSIEGDLEICEGFNGFYQAIPNSGITMFNWTIPSGNGNIITSNPDQSPEIEVNWNIMPGDSGVVCLSANEDCVSGDTCVVVHVIQKPIPEVIEDTSICGLTMKLGGIPDLAGGSWTLLSPSSGAQFSDQNDINTDVSVDSSGSYVFVWSEGDQGCEGSDTVQIDFRESPLANLVDTICDDEGKYYIVTLQIDGGAGSYTIIDGGGDLDSTGLYTSDTILAGQTLLVTFEDEFGCLVSYTLQHQCDCGDITTGTLNTSLLSACVDECIDVVTNDDHVIENGQCVRMILHRDSLLDLNNPYTDTLDIQDFISGGNTFCFDANEMSPGQRYYVHYLVTRCDSMSGEADLSFACLQYATVPVVFHEYPTPVVGPDTMVCGLDAILNAGLSSNHSGSWVRIAGPGNALFAQDIPVSPVTVDQYGTHTFVWTQTNEGCSATDTLRIRFLDAPVINDWFVECDSLQENYRITINNITGGDSTSYLVEGLTIGGNTWTAGQSGNVWTSPWINAGDSLLLIVNDQYGCFPDTLTLRHDCECSTNLGELSVDPTMFCGPLGTAMASYNGGTKGPNDREVFYLHEGSINNIGNIIEYNESGVFSFVPGTMSLNQIYYITVRVGIVDGSGAVVPDYECLVETQGIGVIWYDTPLAMIVPSQDSLYCSQDTLTLDARNSERRASVGQLNYSWSSGNQQHTGETWEITQAGQYELIITNDSTGCSDTTQLTIEQVPGPDLAIFELSHPDCNGNASGSLDIINIQEGRGPYIYRVDGGNPSSNPVFDGLGSGGHTLLVEDRNGCQLDTTFEILEASDLQVMAREDQYLNEGESIDLDSLLASLTGNLNGVRVYWVNEAGDSLLIGRDATLLDSLFKAENPFTLVAINEDGCISIDQLTIFIRVETPDIYIPNVITPNGDNINDVFRLYVSSDKIDHIDKLRIFTRWGELIYENSEVIPFDASGESVDGWDGTFQGDLMNPGVFVYTVDVVDVLGEHQLFAGSVTLLE